MDYLSLAALGAVAGFIDSIAGGGGLITLPALTLTVGPGVHAIGTNKIVGFTGAFIAFLVYLRRGHFEWKSGTAFALSVGAGSTIGSLCSPQVPVAWFRYILLGTVPLILWVVWNKDLWVAHEVKHLPLIANARRTKWARVFAAGVCVGFYDGFWGPGGGTFMLLALLFFARMPLMPALAASKLANTLSAGFSLTSYAIQGFVHPAPGLVMAASMGAAAAIGAQVADKRAAQAVRPALAAVAAFMLARVLLS